jgi:hypothetical protein
LDSGDYQVKNGKQKFTFSLTLAFAENLDLLLSSSTQMGNGGFNFALRFLDTEFSTEVFHDLSNPVFSAERFVASIMASKSDLISFLGELSIIAIHLCQQDQVIGSTNVALGSLITKKGEFAIVENVSRTL